MVSVTFPAEACVLNFFVGRRRWVLPLHRLSLTLWFIMTHQGLVFCHTLMEKSISFTSMTVQMLLTNRLPCTLVIIGQLPSDPSATHFPISEAIKVNIVRRDVTHVEFYGNFIIVTRLSEKKMVLTYNSIQCGRIAEYLLGPNSASSVLMLCRCCHMDLRRGKK